MTTKYLHDYHLIGGVICLFPKFLEGSLTSFVMLLIRESDLDEVEFSRHHAGVKRGDIVGICGYPGWFT